MGNLKPGATYIYERDKGTVYAREIGDDPSTRKEIGWEHVYDESKRFDARTVDGRPLHEHMMEDKMWGDIRRSAPTNPALQKALDRAIMIYKLSKDKI